MKLYDIYYCCNIFNNMLTDGNNIILVIFLDILLHFVSVNIIYRKKVKVINRHVFLAGKFKYFSLYKNSF